LHYWRRPAPKKAALDETEIHTLFDFCKSNPSDNADIMMLIVLIYCRPGEALALKVKDYNPDTHVLHINRTIISHCVLSDDDRTKTDASIRDIAVPQMAHDILIKYSVGKKKDDLLFPAPKKGKGYPKDESNFNHFVKRSLHRCGIDKDLHAHNLRTTGISYAQYKGANVYGVSANAGHRDINTTLHIYTAVYNQQKTDATDVMDRAFNNPPQADCR
jgi:integrase